MTIGSAANNPRNGGSKYAFRSRISSIERWFRIASLLLAIDFGFTFKGQYESDGELQSIKTDIRWKELMKKLDLILNPPIAENIPPRRAHHEMGYDDGSKSIILTGVSTLLNGG